MQLVLAPAAEYHVYQMISSLPPKLMMADHELIMIGSFTLTNRVLNLC